MKQLRATILKEQNMTAPAAEPTAEKGCGRQHENQKDEAKVHHTITKKCHRFAWLYWRNSSAKDKPMQNMNDYKCLDDKQDVTPTTPSFTTRAWSLC